MKEKTKTSTYQTRFSLLSGSGLSEYAELFCRLQRSLFADLSANKNLNELKRTYIAEHGVTARQFNSIYYSLKGKIASAKECQKRNIDTLKDKICCVEKK